MISKNFRGKNTFHVRQQLKATSSRHTPVTTMEKKPFVRQRVSLCYRYATTFQNGKPKRKNRGIMAETN